MSEEQLKKLNARLSEAERLLAIADTFALWTGFDYRTGPTHMEWRKNYKKYLETHK